MDGLSECIMWALVSMMLILCGIGLVLFAGLILGWVVEIRDELAEERLRKALEKEISNEEQSSWISQA